MLKSKLLHAIQNELLRHQLGYLRSSVVYLGCLHCGMLLTTENQYHQHLCRDVLTPLLAKLSSGSRPDFVSVLVRGFKDALREHEHRDFRDHTGVRIGCAKCGLAGNNKQHLEHFCRDVVPAVLDKVTSPRADQVGGVRVSQPRQPRQE